MCIFNLQGNELHPRLFLKGWSEQTLIAEHAVEDFSIKQFMLTYQAAIR